MKYHQMSFKLLFQQKLIISIKNVFLEKEMVTCILVNSLINIILPFTPFYDYLPYYFILSFELNKTFDDIVPNNA